MFGVKNIALASVLAVASASAASAATISVQTFSIAAYDAYVAAQDGVVFSEGFEDYPEAEGDLLGTSVGDFTTIPGGVGSGSSVLGTGEQIAVRDNPNFGRVNTTAGGSNFLDSNDTFGISWALDFGGKRIQRIAFSLSDGADQGAELTVSAGEEVLTSFVGQDNGVVDWIVIEFATSVFGANVSLQNNTLNDGFGIDDATVSTVPLPAGSLLLLTGLGGVAALRRKKK